MSACIRCAHLAITLREIMDEYKGANPSKISNSSQDLPSVARGECRPEANPPGNRSSNARGQRLSGRESSVNTGQMGAADGKVSRPTLRITDENGRSLV